MIILCSINKKKVLLFNNLIVSNLNHSDYPKENIFKEVEEYVLSNIDTNNKDIDINWDNKDLEEIVSKNDIIKSNDLHDIIKNDEPHNINDMLYSIYEILLSNNIIKKLDLDILKIWLKYF